MKKIPEPQLSGAETLTPAEMNKIHFGGKHSHLSPKDIKNIASEENTQPGSSTKASASQILK